MSARTHTAGRAGELAAAVALSLGFDLCVLLDLAPWLRGPAPYPPEWQWAYRSPPAWPTAGAVAGVVVALALLAASATRAAQRRARATGSVLLTAAVLLGVLLPLALLAREPAGGLRTLMARTTSFSSTSYHTVALTEEARDPLAFVRRHAELLPQLATTAKHAATHPPGPVLLFRAAVAACEASPSLTRALLDMAGVPERDFAPPLTRPARAGALLGALLLGLLAALTAWPLWTLARELGFSPLAAGRLAVLWVLLPSPALVAPRFDAALALPVVGFAALLAAALRPDRGGLAGRALLAGICAGAALWLSYGAAAFLAIAAAAVMVARQGPLPSGSWRRPAVALALAAVVALALAFGVPALLGGDPLRAMRTALAIHREAYTAPRSYALWLAFDLVDFAALLGVPIAVLATLRVAAEARGCRRQRLLPSGAFALAVAVGTAALVVSGVARGEVGRIWIPLMPLALLAAFRPAEAEEAQRTALLGLLVSLSTLAVAAAWRL